MSVCPAGKLNSSRLLARSSRSFALRPAKRGIDWSSFARGVGIPTSLENLACVLLSMRRLSRVIRLAVRATCATHLVSCRVHIVAVDAQQSVVDAPGVLAADRCPA